MDFHALARKDLQFLCKKNRIPANVTNVAMANALQALETVEGMDEIQGALGLQSPKKVEGNSPNPPRSVRMSARKSALRDELKIQQPSPFSRLRRVTTKPLELTFLISKEEEGEKKEQPKVFPKTPAKKKGVKAVEASSSRIRAKKEEEGVGPSETPKAVEPKKGKAVGEIIRRSARLSSRKPVEETAAHSYSRRTSRVKAEVTKMGPLGREDADEQEKEEEKNYLATKGDPCADVVEGKDVNNDQVETHVLPSSLDEEVAKVEGQHGHLDDVLFEDKERKEQAGEIQSLAEAGVNKMDYLGREDVNIQETEEKNYLAAKGVSSVHVLHEEDVNNDQVVERHVLSSSLDAEIVKVEGEDGNLDDVFFDEKERKEQGGEIHNLSSPFNKMGSLGREVHEKDEKNNLVTKGNFCVDVLEDKDVKNDQGVESHVLTSSHDGEVVRDENDNSDELVDEEEKQGEIHDLDDEVNWKNPKFEDSSFEFTEGLYHLSANESAKDTGNQPPENELVEDFSDHDKPTKDFSPNNEYVEVSGDLTLGNVIVVEVSGDPSLENKKLPDSVHLSFDATVTVYADSNELASSVTVSEPLEAGLAEDTFDAYAIKMLDFENEVSTIEVQVKDDLTHGSKLAVNSSIDVIQNIEVHQDATFEPQLLDSSSKICTNVLERDSSIEFPKESIQDDLQNAGEPIIAIDDVQQKTEISPGSTEGVLAELSTEDTSIQFKGFCVNFLNKITAASDNILEINELNMKEPVDISTSKLDAQKFEDVAPHPQVASFKLQTSYESPQEIKKRAVSIATPEKLPGEAEKKLENSIKENKLEHLSLKQLRALYKQKLDCTKNEVEKRNSMIKQEDLEFSSNMKQKLNGDKINMLEAKKSVKQEDMACLSRSKLDSNRKKMLNDDSNINERKRTPLKNLN